MNRSLHATTLKGGSGMKIRNVLVAIAVTGLMALAACNQEAQGGAGAGGNPYGASGQPSSSGGAGGMGGGGSMSSGSSGSSSSPMR